MNWDFVRTSECVCKTPARTDRTGPMFETSKAAGYDRYSVESSNSSADLQKTSEGQVVREVKVIRRLEACTRNINLSLAIAGASATALAFSNSWKGVVVHESPMFKLGFL